MIDRCGFTFHKMCQAYGQLQMEQGLWMLHWKLLRIIVDVTLHLLPMPFQSSGTGAPVRTKDVKQWRFWEKINQNRKGKGKSKQNAQGSSTSPKKVSRVHLAVTIAAEQFASISTC